MRKMVGNQNGSLPIGQTVFPERSPFDSVRRPIYEPGLRENCRQNKESSCCSAWTLELDIGEGKERRLGKSVKLVYDGKVSMRLTIDTLCSVLRRCCYGCEINGEKYTGK